MSESIDDAYKVIARFKAEHGIASSAFKMSKATWYHLLNSMPLLVVDARSSFTSLWGTGVEFDETIPLGQFELQSGFPL